MGSHLVPIWERLEAQYSLLISEVDLEKLAHERNWFSVVGVSEAGRM